MESPLVGAEQFENNWDNKRLQEKLRNFSLKMRLHKPPKKFISKQTRDDKKIQRELNAVYLNARKSRNPKARAFFADNDGIRRGRTKMEVHED